MEEHQTDEKMTNRTGIFINKMAALAAAAAVALSIQSCCKTFHTDEDSSISVALDFADESDAEGTTIGDTKLWIFNDDGSLVKGYEYSSAAQLALQRYHLAAGHYLLVTAANLRDPFTWTEPTRATDMESLMFGLKAPASSPAHAFYGVAEVTVEKDKSKIVKSEIRRVLSELTIQMTGAPAGSTLKATLYANAVGVYPAIKGEDGTYGLPTKEDNRSIELPEGKESGGSIVTPVMRLMPTISGSISTIIYLTMTLADGEVLKGTIMAPPMDPSGKYILMIEYLSMSPTMIVNPYKINQWTEGWVVNGEILNPDEY